MSSFFRAQPGSFTALRFVQDDMLRETAGIRIMV